MENELANWRHNEQQLEGAAQAACFPFSLGPDHW